MNRKQLVSRSMILAVPFLVLTACDTAEQPETEMDADTVAGMEAGESDGPVMGIEAVVGADAELAPIDRSGVTGHAFGEVEGEGAALTLTVEGLEAGTAYPAHIHSGSCAAGGPVVVGLGEITAQEDGSGGVTREVTADELPEDETLFIQVHGADGTAVACGDLNRGGPGAP